MAAKSCPKNSFRKYMAERVGFEPTRQFPAYTLSKRAPSTTRPPLPEALLCPDAYARRHYSGDALGSNPALRQNVFFHNQP